MGATLRTFVGAIVLALAGASLVAGLVLGRGDVSGVPVALTLADLDSGGVLVIRTERYDRHGAKSEQIANRVAEGEIGLFPEHRNVETRLLFGNDGAAAGMATVVWLADGPLLERVRITPEGLIVTERPEFGIREERELGSPAVDSAFIPSQLYDQARAEMEAAVAAGEWTEVAVRPGLLRWERRSRIHPSDLLAPTGPGLSVPYYGDLDAVELVRELTSTTDYHPVSEESFVVLADGSRVLVESRRTTLKVLPAASWEAFVAKVWGD